MKIAAKNIKKTYKGRLVLDIEAVEFGPDRPTVITGPNGSGKTSLIRLLSLIEKPDEGSVEIDGVPAPENGSGRLQLRRRVTTVFAEPRFFNTTVIKNVAYPLKIRGANHKSRKAEALKALQETGMAEFAESLVLDLSSGEMRRVALARAMVIRPDAIFLDEPFHNLDNESVTSLMKLLPKISEGGRTMVLVTHYPESVSELVADHIFLVDGRIADGNKV